MSSIEGVGGPAEILATAFAAKTGETEPEEPTQRAEESGASPKKAAAAPAGQNDDEEQSQMAETGSAMESSSIDTQV